MAKSKEDEKATAADIAQEEQDGGKIYYHATSVEGVAAIIASGYLVGSVWERKHVFVWRLAPNKKALELLRYNGGDDANR